MNLYDLGKYVSKFILMPIFWVKVIGRENVPKTGPVIICTNHISNFDPPVVGFSNKRRVTFMAKQELFEKPIIGPIMRGIRALPVKRGLSDRSALRSGLELLKENRVLGLFPEGTRSKDGQLGKGLSGAGFFGLRSNATVIPCAIIGPYKPFRRLRIIYGEPIDFDTLREEKVSAKEATEVIMNKIRNLQEDATS